MFKDGCLQFHPQRHWVNTPQTFHYPFRVVSSGWDFDQHRGRAYDTISLTYFALLGLRGVRFISGTCFVVGLRGLDIPLFDNLVQESSIARESFTFSQIQAPPSAVPCELPGQPFEFDESLPLTLLYLRIPWMFADQVVLDDNLWLDDGVRHCSDQDRNPLTNKSQLQFKRARKPSQDAARHWCITSKCEITKCIRYPKDFDIHMLSPAQM